MLKSKLRRKKLCVRPICTRFSGIWMNGDYSELQWSFRGGTRGNAVPIVKIPLERMGTAFPLLNYGENAAV